MGKLRLYYDGNKTMSGNSYMDTCLTTFNGDSIILLYRKNAADDWHELSNYSKFKINNKTGFLTTDSLRFGEYVFANGHSNILTGIKENKKQQVQINIFPNPSSSVLNIAIDNFKFVSTSFIEIYDMQGKIVKHIDAFASENAISIEDFSKGTYVLSLMDKNKKVASKTFVVE